MENLFSAAVAQCTAKPGAMGEQRFIFFRLPPKNAPLRSSFHLLARVGTIAGVFNVYLRLSMLTCLHTCLQQ